MKKESYSFAEVEAAVCLSEATYEEDIPEIQEYLSNHGISAFRQDLITDCAPKLEAAYQKAVSFLGEHGQCFDLELVPRILREVIRVSTTQITEQRIWDEATVKVIWILEFNDALQLHIKTSIEDEVPDEHEFYLLYSEHGMVDVKTAVENYAKSLADAHPDEMKNRLNVVYESDTDKIVSIHESPTLCDEELARFYIHEPAGCDSDRAFNQISVPFGTPKESVIGSKMSDWR